MAGNYDVANTQQIYTTASTYEEVKTLENEEDVSVWDFSDMSEDVSDEVLSSSDSFITGSSESVNWITETPTYTSSGKKGTITTNTETPTYTQSPQVTFGTITPTFTEVTGDTLTVEESPLFINLTPEKSREIQYGSEASELSEEDKLTYEYQKDMAELNGEIEETEVSPGVTQKTFGDYTETTIELYDGKSYSELSELEQAKIDAWKADCKVAELEGTEAPECPYELTTETRVKLTPEAAEESEKTQAEEEREEKYGEILTKPLQEDDELSGILELVEGIEDPYSRTPGYGYYDGEVANVTSPEEGVTQIQYEDGYVVTTCELYDGKTYEQLSDEDKALIDEWKEEYKEWQEKSRTLQYINNDPPECPLEQTTETRGKQGEVPVTRTYTTTPLIPDIKWGGIDITPIELPTGIDIDTLRDYTTE